MVTQHAQENWKIHSQNLTQGQIRTMKTAMAQAISKNTSIAIVAEIPTCDNSHRDNWAMNDRLVVIIRNGTVKTVMLSRKNQINKDHLRTVQIWRVRKVD
jgi:hypothetical protein